MDKDELVFEIGNLLLADTQVKGETWDDLVFVGEIRENGHSGYGFLYSLGGSVRSFAPRVTEHPPIYDRLRELHEEMGEDWKFCVVRINRDSGKLSMDFEVDPLKWKMSPANFEKLKDELRPHE